MAAGDHTLLTTAMVTLCTIYTIKPYCNEYAFTNNTHAINAMHQGSIPIEKV
jgi:hypothetical protein